MRWLLPGSKVTRGYENRAFFGGLHEASIHLQDSYVFLEMDENNSQVQGRVQAAFPEAERVEGALAVFLGRRA